MSRERVYCTASSSQRTWREEEWIHGRGACPDCGKSVAIYSAQFFFPHGLASRHSPPLGVTPSPYGHHQP